MEERELSHQVFRIVEEDLVFEPLNSVNNEHGKFMSMEYFTDEDDGTFPKVEDYVRLAQSMDRNGIAAYLNWCGKRKNIIDFGYYKAKRENAYSGKATIVFKKPIKMVIGILDSKPVIIDVLKIKGEFTFEWSWYKERGRQRKIANICEIFFDCKELYSYE